MLLPRTIDPHTISRALDTRAGSNVTNYDDKQVDALIDRMRAAATDEAFRCLLCRRRGVQRVLARARGDGMKHLRGTTVGLQVHKW